VYEYELTISYCKNTAAAEQIASKELNTIYCYSGLFRHCHSEER